MKKVTAKQIKRGATDNNTMRAEYDFSKAVRGGTAARYARGTNVVVLEPDVVRMFPNATAVNEALRALGGILRRVPRSRGRNRVAATP